MCVLDKARCRIVRSRRVSAANDLTRSVYGGAQCFQWKALLQNALYLKCNEVFIRPTFFLFLGIPDVKPPVRVRRCVLGSLAESFTRLPL